MMNKSIQYYLGIDGGGTKTVFLLTDTRGVKLCSVTLGASNPNDVGFDTTCALLSDGIRAVTGGYDRAAISCFAGIAGAATGDHASRITEFLRSLGFARAEAASDLALSLAVCLGDDDGIAVIAGTGSVAVGRHSSEHGEQLYRAGGYGYLFGDAGSGFALGQGAILAALQAEDGSGAPTILQGMVADQCGTERVLSSLSDFYRGGKTEIARYAPLIFKAHAQGDAVATKILTDNVRAMAASVRALAERMGMDHVRVGICGGLGNQHAVLLPLLQDALSDDGRTYSLLAAQDAPIQGALYLASQL